MRRRTISLILWVLDVVVAHGRRMDTGSKFTGFVILCSQDLAFAFLRLLKLVSRQKAPKYFDANAVARPAGV
jgi:hypothetical protein